MATALFTVFHVFDASIRSSGSHTVGFNNYDYTTETTPNGTTTDSLTIAALTTLNSAHWRNDGYAEGVQDLLELEIPSTDITGAIPADAAISSIFATWTLDWKIDGLSSLVKNDPSFPDVTPDYTFAAESDITILPETVGQVFQDTSTTSIGSFSHTHEYVSGGPVGRGYLLATNRRRFLWSAGGGRTMDAVISDPIASYTALDKHTPVSWALSCSYLVTYSVPPVQLTIDPDFGPVAGGTAVVITGTGFVDTPTVTFDGVAATGVVFISDIEIHCVTPAHIVANASVVVTNPDTQVCTVPMLYSYTDDPFPPPIQDAVATATGARSGPTRGGTTIYITGSRFQPGCSVTVGGVAATSVTWLSAGLISCVTPPHAAGAAAIVVTNADTGVCTVPLDFTYTHRDTRIKLASSPPWQTVDQWALHRLDLTPTKQGPSGGNN